MSQSGQPDISVGAYAVEALSASGDVLASQNFDVSFSLLSNPPEEIDPAPFETTVLMPPDTRSLRIKHGATILGVRPVSENAPSVTQIAPVPGVTVSGRSPITWLSSDSDGDELSHMVEYSHDGQEWRILETNVKGTQLTANFDALPGGSQARVRVIVTDGVNTSSATTRPSTWPKNHLRCLSKVLAMAPVICPAIL